MAKKKTKKSKEAVAKSNDMLLKLLDLETDGCFQIMHGRIDKARDSAEIVQIVKDGFEHIGTIRKAAIEAIK